MKSKAIKHLLTIFKHKYYVLKYCNMCGLYYQGIMHDMSKFSPVEFFDNIKYYVEGDSPVNESKRIKGYSIAWQHHKGRNPHHYEYWIDNLDKGGEPIKMPFKYALEMICDYLGAGQAYNKEKFTIESEIRWWEEKRDKSKIHPNTKWLINYLFAKMYKDGIKETLTNKKLLKQLKVTYENKKEVI